MYLALPAPLKLTKQKKNIDTHHSVNKRMGQPPRLQRDGAMDTSRAPQARFFFLWFVSLLGPFTIVFVGKIQILDCQQNPNTRQKYSWYKHGLVGLRMLFRRPNDLVCHMDAIVSKIQILAWIPVNGWKSTCNMQILALSHAHWQKSVSIETKYWWKNVLNKWNIETHTPNCSQALRHQRW